jgi:predicted DNA binding CopG/RHH family protein
MKQLGRPQGSHIKGSTTRAIRFPVKIWDALKKEAGKQGMSANGYLLEVLKEKLK